MAERGEGNDEQDGRAKLDGSEEPSPLGAAEPLIVGPGRERSGTGLADRMPSMPKGPRSWRWWIVIAAVVLALALAGPFIQGWKKTPKNRIGISYGGGPIEAVHFQRIVAPGSGLFFNGLFDSLYLYPSDQQNYIISKQLGVGAQKRPDSVVAPTSDRVPVTYQVAVYFKLNTNLLRPFHEQFGIQYQAYTSQGWANLIRDTFRQQIENAIQEETRTVSVSEIYGNAERLVGLQNRVQAKMSQRLRDAMGAAYFCSPRFQPGGRCGDPTFTIKAVTIPSSVAASFQQIVASLNEIQSREAQAEAIRASGLTNEQYISLRAVDSGKINLWVVPSNGGVTIAAPGPAGGAASPSTSSSSTTTTSTPKK